MDYSKYKFNYFDVVKRHERIINRPKDWEIKVLAFIMLFVTFFYVFTSGVFANEIETIDYDIVNGITISSNSNVFVSSSSSVGYVQIEPGYIYYFKNNNTSSSRSIAVSDDIPALNGTYNLIGSIAGGDTYTYRSDTGSSYIYFDFSASSTGTFSVTREKIGSYDGAVNDLVDNVGVNQIWSVFNDGIDFVGVVVLVAFGLFLVVLAIKKVSKGKSDF